MEIGLTKTGTKILLTINILIHLPLIDATCVTTEGDECGFPFVNGETYHHCTSKDNNGIPWCYHVNNAASPTTGLTYGNCDMSTCGNIINKRFIVNS